MKLRLRLEEICTTVDLRVTKADDGCEGHKVRCSCPDQMEGTRLLADGDEEKSGDGQQEVCRGLGV